LNNLIKSFIALYGSETWTLGENEERVVNAFEICCWRRMLKTKWTVRKMNYTVFQRAREERFITFSGSATQRGT
jgi:hypothetical protein